MGKVLFYAKCRPQDCDLWPIAHKTRRVFIGYPAYKNGVTDGMAARWRAKGVGAFFANIASDAWDNISLHDLESSY